MLQTINRNKVWKNDFIFFNDLIKKSPKFTHSYNVIGLEYLKQNKKEKAIDYFKKTIEVTPEYITAITAYIYLGIIYRERGQYTLARKTLEKALDLDINGILPEERNNLYYNLGLLYYFSNQFEKAINFFKLSISAYPYMLSSYHDLICVYGKMGLYKEAVEVYKHAKEKGLNSPNMEEKYYLLKQLINDKKIM